MSVSDPAARTPTWASQFPRTVEEPAGFGQATRQNRGGGGATRGGSDAGEPRGKVRIWAKIAGGEALSVQGGRAGRWSEQHGAGAALRNRIAGRLEQVLDDGPGVLDRDHEGRGRVAQ